MDLYPVLLAIACIGGIATLLLTSFCTTLIGSLRPGGWSAGGGLGPITILLLPNRTLELRLLEKTIYTYIIPEEEGEPAGEKADEEEDILKAAEEETAFPISALLKLPISIESVTINGRFGTGDAGETGKLYGWIAALRGALRTTRLDINIIPDFAETVWSARFRARIRIRSLYHLIYALLPLVRG